MTHFSGHSTERIKLSLFHQGLLDVF